MAWGWTELTKPRGAHRFYRVGRSSRSGIAMLMVITSILFMTVMISEIQYSATVRLKLAAHQRDEAKAEALAMSGLQMYQLILVASKKIGKNPLVAQYLGADALWQAVPFINTGFMRMIFVTGGDMDEVLPEDEVERAQALDDAGNGKDLLTEEQRAESRESSTASSDKSFLDFDGDFYAEVIDEERRINISLLSAQDTATLREKDPVAQRLYAMMSGKDFCNGIEGSLDPLNGSFNTIDLSSENDHDQFFYEKDIERWDIIANLADWVDADDMSMALTGGREDSMYENLEDPYLAKNAKFDSMAEVRLVDGWHDDDIWERYGEYLTIYGAGKVNINTADCVVLRALMTAYIEPKTPEAINAALQGVMMQRAQGVPVSNVQGFVQQLTTYGQGTHPVMQPQMRFAVQPGLAQAITTESTVFRVKSVGQVNQATVTIEAVLDFTQSNTGKIVYYKVQ